MLELVDDDVSEVINLDVEEELDDEVQRLLGSYVLIILKDV